MARNPEKDANRKAKREMHEAVDKVIDERRRSRSGPRRQRKKSPLISMRPPHKTRRRCNVTQRLRTNEVRSFMPNIRTDKQLVTQITVVESEPESRPRHCP